ncbi:MAG: mechanosensitive ion channel [Deltaproteobacteria bacterium]|jgi:MscS family membrane protein|nr:mechanosensitive ion channel [Deltaproteobacteria bacterium]
MIEFESYFSLFEKNFILMPLWKWTLVLLFLVLFPFLRKTLEIILIRFKQKAPSLFEKNKFIKYGTPFNLESPLSWILSLGLFILFVDLMDFPLTINKYALLIGRFLLALRLIQLVYVGTDSLALFLKEQVFSSESNNQIQVLPFFIKILKVMVITLGFLITLQNLGLNVVSLLAGLGLGGLAIALAAQDTVANLFGSITILFDKPFKIGDQIKVLDVEGSIEEIGFRSTRIRSVNNSLFTIPNSILAKEKIENLSDRISRKTKQTLTITYETPIEKINLYIDYIKNLLLNYESVEKESIIVSFNNFSSHSLDILVAFNIKIDDYKSFLELQEKILFDIYRNALEQKVDFAYPTQKLIIEK